MFEGLLGFPSMLWDGILLCGIIGTCGNIYRYVIYPYIIDRRKLTEVAEQ